MPSQTPATGSTTNPRLLLITSLPNLSHYPTRQAFHGALLDFTRDYSPNSSPLVMVIPDVGHSGAAEEPWSARGGADNSSDGAWDLKSVVGEAVLASPAVTTIE
jgi:cell cycle checkpoint protein